MSRKDLKSEKLRREGKAWVKIAEANPETKLKTKEVTKNQRTTLMAYDEARRYFHEAGDQENECIVFFKLAELCAKMGLFGEARKALQEGVQIANDIVDYAGQSNGMRMLGRLLQADGDDEQAVRLYYKAQAIAQRSKYISQKHHELSEAITSLECQKTEKEWMEHSCKVSAASSGFEVFLDVAAVLTFVSACISTVVLLYLQGFHIRGFALEPKLMYWTCGATIGSLASIVMLRYKARFKQSSVSKHRA